MAVNDMKKIETGMKYVLRIIMLLCFAPVVFGQEEGLVSRKVTDDFVLHYNAGDYDEIFAMFSAEMQNALPLEQTKDFLTGLNRQAGKITKREFLKYEQTYASYKTTFERGLLIVNISVDKHDKINGLFVRPYVENNAPKPERNKTKLILPFNDEWTVVWGGDTKELNYHIQHQAQKNAFDFVITNEQGKSFRTDGKTNEDYYAFGQELVAPCAGEVVLVVDGVKDNVPGVMNPIFVSGNTVILKTDNDEYLFFAHFKQHSIVVKQGDRVKQGQLLGLCGNSGNSSEAHLHFHLQNIEDMNTATGIKCYFEKIIVNGEQKTDYSPIQREKVSRHK